MSARIVYVVDDEAPIRGALKMMLAIRGYDVTPFAAGPDFLDGVDSLAPGCLLLDLRLPGMDGIEVQHRLSRRRSDMPVVMMTGHGDIEIAVAALRAGAVTLIEKPFAKAALRRALDKAFLKLEDPAQYEALIAASRSTVARLESEDRAMLAQLAAGRSNEAIAGALRMTPSQVEIRRARLFELLGIGSVNEAVTIAAACGLERSSRLSDITY
jgi:two-component system response regulator FixJ